MQLIKPKQISGETMTLIEEASKQLIIISPYYNVSKWYKLLNAFDSLKNKNVSVEFYVRKSEPVSICEIKSIGFIPFEIPNLHTKLYLNESYGIVSSMNLNVSSDTNSLDIAYKTETEEEYLELYKYYETYIKIHSGIKVDNTKKNQPAITTTQAVKGHTSLEVESSPPFFKDYLLADPLINSNNWQEITLNFIKAKLESIYARQFKKDGTMYFSNKIANFGCFFWEYRKKTFFRIKINLGESLLDAVIKNFSELTKYSGAKIELPNPAFNFTDIFISYDEEVLSKNMNYVCNDDVATIIKTISCALYVLASANYFRLLNQVPVKDGVLTWKY